MKKHESSFRDPDGFVFRHGAEIRRQINSGGMAAYQQLMSSGLYEQLSSKGWLIRHDEIMKDAGQAVLRPEQVPFISYPYEWCFGQVRDAALLTLKIQKAALKQGMTLKDASAYNIQFLRGRPVLIDTSSLALYEEGKPWIAFRQFCQHFLAPLALMKHRDIRLGQLLRVHLDGVPLDLASALLPWHTWLNLTIASNIHLHSRFQKKYAGGKTALPERKVSAKGLNALIGLLESYITGLDWKPKGTEWSAYYGNTNYSAPAMQQKIETVKEMITQVQPATVCDFGANEGVFSRLASSMGIFTVSCDIDPAAVELNYRKMKAEQEQNLLPLLIDITNPPGGSGWNNVERASFSERNKSGMGLMLALIHHLCISNNLPFSNVAAMAAEACRHLIIEFVPRTDSQVQRLLSSREDIFSGYDETNFELEFGRHFEVLAKKPVAGSERIIYLMKSKHPGD